MVRTGKPRSPCPNAGAAILSPSSLGMACKNRAQSCHQADLSGQSLHFTKKCVCVCVCVCKLLGHVRLFATPWIIAHQDPLSREFSRQEYCRGLPLPSPGRLLDPGIKPGSPALQADSLPSETPVKPTKRFCGPKKTHPSRHQVRNLGIKALQGYTQHWLAGECLLPPRHQALGFSPGS